MHCRRDRAALPDRDGTSRPCCLPLHQRGVLRAGGAGRWPPPVARGV